jgi:hypothetical protein
MKYLSLLFALPLLFSGCDKIKQVSFNSEFSVTFAVNETSAGTNLPYFEMEAINLADDPDLEPYINDIKEITIKSISYKIENYSGAEDISFEGEIGFSKISAAAPELFSSTSPVLLFEKNQETTKTLLDFDSNATNRIRDILLSEKAIRVYADGLMSHGPASFDLKVYVFATITAETEE